MKRKSFVRISTLLWADILVAYALFVMQNYLTNVWKLSLVHAAGILNIWDGISKILPVFFLFLVDAFLGNFTMLVISSVTYSAEISLVTMSTPPVLANSTGMCKKYEPHCIGHTQRTLFYTGMTLIAIGGAGNLVSVRPFLEQQVERPNNTAVRGGNGGRRELLKMLIFLVVVIVTIVGVVALPYIKPWTLRFGIPAICTVVATVMFLSGWCTYTKVEPKGSPITRVCRVFVAAVYKKSEPFAENLYEGDDNNGSESFSRTRFLRCLEKAAIELPNRDPEEEKRKWRLSSVTDVEAAKIAVRMIPMWATFIICGIVSSTGNTYFIEQANKMNRKLGSWKLPLQILRLLQKWMKNFVAAPLADRVLKKHNAYGAPLGIALAMIFSILCCIVAALVEIRRIRVIRSRGLLHKPEDSIPMSVFLLLFQFFLLAGLDSFFDKSVGAFFEGESPECMRSYLNYFTKGVSGLGYMCSVLCVYVVGKISEKGGKENWFQFTLNRSRLDRYYWVLAWLSSVDLIVFVLVALQYRYREARDEGPAPADIQDLSNASHGIWYNWFDEYIWTFISILVDKIINFILCFI